MDPNQVVPILKSMGVNPDKLDSKHLDMLSRMYKGFSDSPEFRDAVKTAKNHIKPPPPKESGKRQGRNDKCQCGSGKKYKKCCLMKK